MKSTLSLLLLVQLSIVLAIDNCFHGNHLTYVYNIPDYSGNYTNVKEYWMRLDTTCYLLVDVKTKLTWYSTDMSAKYQMYYNN